MVTILLEMTLVAASDASSLSEPPFGIQTGDDDLFNHSSAFAVSMIYNEYNKEMIITGGTYGSYFQPTNDGEARPQSSISLPSSISSSLSNSTLLEGEQPTSDCFVSILHLPHRNSNGKMTDPQKVSWVRRRQYGDPSVNEFCSDVAIVGSSSNSGRHSNTSSILTVGYSHEGGLLTSFRPYGTSRRHTYGVLLNMGYDMELRNGVLLHSNHIQFPVAIVTAPDTDEAFIAEIFSDMDSITADVSYTSSVFDRSASGYSLPIPEGGRYSVRLRQTIRLNQDDTIQSQSSRTGTTSQGVVSGQIGDGTFTSGWTREYGTLGMDDVLLSSLSYHRGTASILMTGYTAGSGSAFGEANNETTGDKNEDGFLTRIDPVSGNVVNVLRIHSAFMPGNDRVLSVCHHQENQVDASPSYSEVYLAGYTDGLFDSSSFTDGNVTQGNSDSAILLKVDLESMDIIWTRQIGGSMQVQQSNFSPSGLQLHGMSCTVTQDGADVYLAGNVIEGTSPSRLNSSTGNVLGSGDIFVAQFTAAAGDLVFFQQFGTPEKDTLARGNSLATDAIGNLMVLGNTEGSWFRPKIPNGSSDVVVFSVSRDSGNYMTPLSTVGDNETSTNTQGGGHTQAVSGAESRNDAGKKGITFFLYILVMVVVCTIGVLFARRRRKKKLILKQPSKIHEIRASYSSDTTSNVGEAIISSPSDMWNDDEEENLFAKLSRDRQYRITMLKKLTNDRRYSTTVAGSNANPALTVSNKNGITNPIGFPTNVFGRPYRDVVDGMNDSGRGDTGDVLSDASKRMSLDDIVQVSPMNNRDNSDDDDDIQSSNDDSLTLDLV